MLTAVASPQGSRHQNHRATSSTSPPSVTGGAVHGWRTSTQVSLHSLWKFDALVSIRSPYRRSAPVSVVFRGTTSGHASSERWERFPLFGWSSSSRVEDRSIRGAEGRLPGDLRPIGYWPTVASNSSPFREQRIRHRLSRQTAGSSVPGSKSRSRPAVMGLMGVSRPASGSSARASASESMGSRRRWRG